LITSRARTAKPITEEDYTVIEKEEKTNGITLIFWTNILKNQMDKET
jgi:hypothetical protein